MVRLSAWSEQVTALTFEAGSALSGAQYKFVAISSSGNVNLSVSGGVVDGVLMNKPGSGEAATVAVEGVCKVVAGGVITAGTLVTSDSGGAAQTAATGGLYAGRALVGATAAGAVIPVLLMHTRNAVTG